MVSQAELILRVITLWFLVLSQFFRDGMGPFKLNYIGLHNFSFVLCSDPEILPPPPLSENLNILPQVTESLKRDTNNIIVGSYENHMKVHNKFNVLTMFQS